MSAYNLPVIVVVDAETRVHTLVAAALAPLGVRVEGLTDPRTALSRIGACDAIAILVDANLPHVDGLELTRRLKRSSATAGIPVLFLSDEHSLENRIAAFALGARDYISKPFAPAELRARVDNIVRTQAMLRELERQAYIDALTGLANRRTFNDGIAAHLDRGRSDQNHNFAVLMFDFDRFKLVNDTLGHPVGDALLCSIADRFRATLRPDDDAARLGGDEFGVIVAGLRSSSEVAEVCARLVETFAVAHQLDEHTVTSTASIGVVPEAHRYTDAHDVLRDADIALYQAKSHGRGRYEFFDEAARRESTRRHLLEQRLRSALECRELSNLYQPIVSLETGEVEGLEALTRWTDPEHGEVPPDEFISLAEETGLIVPLGQQCLEQACQDLHAWREVHGDGLFLTVNLSRRQLIQPDLVDTVRSALDRSGIEPSALHLEVTETTILDPRFDAVGALQRLRSLGVQLALDDFGTGQSALACLHELPIDMVKIDKSFVGRLDQNVEFTAIVQAILVLCHNLGKVVVAEGIESPEQLVQLQALDCQLGQGWLVGRPQPVPTSEPARATAK